MVATVPQFPRASNPSPQGPTLADLLAAYERDYLPHKAPRTQYIERGLFRWLREELGAIPLLALSPLVLRTWRDALRRRYKPNTIRRYLTSLSAVLTAGVEEYEWLTHHPLRQVVKPPSPPDRERCLTRAEMGRLFTACQESKSSHIFLAVVLALSTGARKNELLQRAWSDLDLERGTLRLARTKNGERRPVALVGPALVLLRQHAQRSGHTNWVFPSADGRKPVFIDYAWRKACAQAGLADFHFHDLRHTSASFLAMSGASLRDIAEISGHKSLKQTMKYTHLLEPYTRGVLARMVEQHLDEAIATAAALPGP